MNILRRFGLTLATLLFSLSIPILALFVSLYFTIDTPQLLKKTLSDSGIYTVLAPDILSQQANVASSIPIGDPGVQQAFEQAIPPSFLQKSSEQIIDGSYDWIHGTTPTPNFSIDLTPVKTTFADNITSYIQQKLDALPLCNQLIAPPTSLDELLALTCMPRGVSTATIASTARQEALDSKLLSENDTIDTSTLQDAQGSSITDKLSFVPRLHHYYILSLTILPILILLCAAAIIFWSTTKRAGIKRMAWLLISAGITGMILAAIEVWLLHAGVSLLGTPISASPSIQDKILIVLETLATNIRVWWFGFGAGYTIVGIILLVVLRFNRPEPTLTMSKHTPDPLPIDSAGYEK